MSSAAHAAPTAPTAPVGESPPAVAASTSITETPEPLDIYLPLPGEDLVAIAERHGTTAEKLCQLNAGLVAPDPGAAMRVPATGVPPRRRVALRAQEGQSVAALAEQLGMDDSQLRWLNRWQEGEEPEPGEQVVALAALPDRKHGIAANGQLFKSRFDEPTQMPSQPELYVLKRPDNAWGTRDTVDALVEIAVSLKRAFPEGKPLVIGDISRQWGGRFRPHASHRNGNDVDMGLPMAVAPANLRFARAKQDSLDVPRTWHLIRAAVATGRVQYIFLDRRLQLALRDYAQKTEGLKATELNEIFQAPDGPGTRRGVVRHERGHSDHIHIRFDHDRSYVSQGLLRKLRGQTLPSEAEELVQTMRCKAVAASALLDEVRSATEGQQGSPGH